MATLASMLSSTLVTTSHDAENQLSHQYAKTLEVIIHRGDKYQV
jgi:hypothetical protein